MAPLLVIVIMIIGAYIFKFLFIILLIICVFKAKSPNSGTTLKHDIGFILSIICYFVTQIMTMRSH